MKRKLVLVASLAAGVIAALLTRLYVASREADVRAQKEALLRRYRAIEVLCFAKETPGGTAISRGDLGTRTVPELGLRGQAVTLENLGDVLGRKTLLGHKTGDVLFWSDVEGGNPRDAGLSSEVKRGMRAVSINCSGAASVSGLVRPNDHVDVIGTFAFPGADGKVRGGDVETRTILQNVLVLATGQTTAKTPRGEIPVSQLGYATVTLEVSPREAELLAFTEQLRGRLTLTLRSRSDTTYEEKLPKVDFEKVKLTIEELNRLRQQKKLYGGRGA